MTQPPSSAATNSSAGSTVPGAAADFGPGGTGALLTPALLLDELVMQRNLQRMREHLAGQGVVPRPHVKTAKSLPVIEQMVCPATDSSAASRSPASATPATTPAADAPRLTVSTLREAAEVVAAGYRDVLYAVGIVPPKLQALGNLARESGARVAVILDSVAMARALVAGAPDVEAFIELDVDDHRAGVYPESEELLAIGAVLSSAGARAPGGSGPPASRLRGVMTHAGGAYDCHSRAELETMAERERSGAVLAATRLRSAGIDCAEVSIGSTPTVAVAHSFAGVTEVRVGVYVFNDLVMAGLGVCQIDDIALSVLSTVIGHQPRRNTLLIDAGWMALSSDRSTNWHSLDQGLGRVVQPRSAGAESAATDHGAELLVTGANQEHGLVQRRDGGAFNLGDYPIGSLLRVLPVHACATAAQFNGYHRLAADHGAGSDPGAGTAVPAIAGFWPRFGGWHA